jgi:hypothetical protein
VPQSRSGRCGEEKILDPYREVVRELKKLETNIKGNELYFNERHYVLNISALMRKRNWDKI